MSIVKMKKLRLLCLSDERAGLLKDLQLMGSVEVGDIGEDLAGSPGGENFRRCSAPLSDLRTAAAQLSSAIAALDRYAPQKRGLFDPRPDLTVEEYFDDSVLARAKDTAAAINARSAEITAAHSEAARLRGELASLIPWTGLGFPLDLASTKTTDVFLGTLPALMEFGEAEAALAAESELSSLRLISADKAAQYVSLITHKSDTEAALNALRAYGFTKVTFPGRVGTAEENIKSAEDAIAAAGIAAENAEKAIAEMSGERNALFFSVERLAEDIRRGEAEEKLSTSGSVFALEGWVPAEDVEKLSALLEKYTCAWETEDPTEEEFAEVPVYLKSGKISTPLNMVTEMYSLPAYNSLDPNPLMAPFFIFFYGFMMADMGYGLLMMAASLFIMKKAKPKGPTMKHMIPLLGLCGVSTFIMGAMTGGFFGDMLPQLAMMLNPDTTFTALPALFSPLDDALAVLIGSLAIGLCQIFTGMGISMYKQIKRGEVMAAICNEGAWFAVFILFAVGILTNNLGIAGIAIGVILVVTQGYGKKGIVGKLMGIGGSLYSNLTGYFSDILSYSRLMALMLSGAVIAQVFNTLGGITGNIVLFFIISMIGNGINFALNILGCFVHDMRLQCLEFFGRFYEDGGKPYKPLRVGTIKINIVKK